MGSRKKKKKGKQKKWHPQPKAGARPPGFPEGVTIVHPGPGETKMSEVLWEFVEPYLGHARSEDALHKLLTVALIAWNASLVPDNQRERFIQDMVETVPLEARQPMAAIIVEMMQRKQTHFASYTRIIVDYHLTSTPSGPHLSVISTITGD